MNLYTDDNPHTTLKGLGFKDKKTAVNTIKIVEEHFDKMRKKQKIPGFNPNNLLPNKFITSEKEANKYYKLQKFYRIIGMRNRAKGILKNTQNTKNLIEAIKIFDEWLSNYP